MGVGQRAMISLVAAMPSTSGMPMSIRISVRAQGAAGLDGLGAVAGGCHDLVAHLGEQRLERQRDDELVFGHQHPDPLCHGAPTL